MTARNRIKVCVLSWCARIASWLAVDALGRRQVGGHGAHHLVLVEVPDHAREGHEPGLATLYSTNRGQAPCRKQFRHVPQTQERILDAPDLVDDYYLNLLDWSASNQVCC